MSRNLNHLLFLALLLFWPTINNAEVLTAPYERYSKDRFPQFMGHQGFYPFICEFGYRTLADHVIDFNYVHFDPSSVKKGDIIYVGVWYLEWFIKQAHDRIPNPYILITCDVGDWLPKLYHTKLAYDPKVVYWFGKNMLFTNHSKLFQLPMGQFYYLWAHGIDYFIDKLRQIPLNLPPKDIFLYLNYTERNHGRRSTVTDKFWDKPYCFNRNRPRTALPFDQFWEEIARSKFVLSPLGLEVDCTRTWECFVLDAIPIVEHSYLDPLYEELPILLVHEWDQITEDFLHEQYDEIHSKPYTPEKAYLDYWARLIKEKQALVRSGKLEASLLEKNNFSKEDIKTFQNLLTQEGKSHSPLVVRGNGTLLRPFQLARACPKIEEIKVFDLWSSQNLSYMKQFCTDKSLFRDTRVKIHDSNVIDLSFARSSSKSKTYFLDLTHFRHSLFTSTAQLSDFSHSLEKDIEQVFKKLHSGDLLLGNMSNDTYVREVIERLKETKGIAFQIQGNFFYVSI